MHRCVFKIFLGRTYFSSFFICSVPSKTVRGKRKKGKCLKYMQIDGWRVMLGKLVRKGPWQRSHLNRDLPRWEAKQAALHFGSAGGLWGEVVSCPLVYCSSACLFGSCSTNTCRSHTVETTCGVKGNYHWPVWPLHPEAVCVEVPTATQSANTCFPKCLLPSTPKAKNRAWGSARRNSPGVISMKSVCQLCNNF